MNFLRKPHSLLPLGIFTMCVFLHAQTGASRAAEGDKTVKVTVSQADMKESPHRMKQALAKGDKLEVWLEQQATGYTWKLTGNNPRELKLEGEPRRETGASKPGAPEFKVFRFDVLDSGSLEFQLARPFGAPDAKVLQLKIEAQAPPQVPNSK